MEPTEPKTYQPREFAKLAGVTVRALHHYDRIGLLKPKRTGAGYRTYAPQDLTRLEQIIALKFIGVPLKKIRFFTAGTPGGLTNALRAQRQTLEEKRRLLDQAIGAIGELEKLMGKPVSSVELGRHQSAQEWNPQMATFVDKPVWDFMTRVLAARP